MSMMSSACKTIMIVQSLSYHLD